MITRWLHYGKISEAAHIHSQGLLHASFYKSGSFKKLIFLSPLVDADYDIPVPRDQMLRCKSGLLNQASSSSVCSVRGRAWKSRTCLIHIFPK